MNEPHWIDRHALELLHDESLAEHGGSSGLRDDNMLESALARPLNLFAYEETTDVPRLAAAYAFGIAKNHPFVDGNKRAAFLACGLFLALNGLLLETTQVDAYETMIALASGAIDEEGFADWIRAHSRPT